MTLPTRLRRIAAFPLHPFLAAAFPVVFLYAQNVQEAISPFELLLPLGLSLGITAVVVLAFRALTRSWAAGALIGTLLLALFFTYGAAWQWLGEMLLGQWVLVAAWLLVAVIGVSFVRRLGSWTERLSMPLNAIGAVVLGYNLVIIGASSLSRSTSERPDCFSGASFPPAGDRWPRVSSRPTVARSCSTLPSSMCSVGWECSTCRCSSLSTVPCLRLLWPDVAQCRALS